jgi:hypothetical protein
MQEIENHDIGAVSKGINRVPSFVKIYQIAQTLNTLKQTIWQHVKATFLYYKELK